MTAPTMNRVEWAAWRAGYVAGWHRELTQAQEDRSRSEWAYRAGVEAARVPGAPQRDGRGMEVR